MLPADFLVAGQIAPRLAHDPYGHALRLLPARGAEEDVLLRGSVRRPHVEWLPYHLSRSALLPAHAYEHALRSRPVSCRAVQSALRLLHAVSNRGVFGRC